MKTFIIQLTEHSFFAKNGRSQTYSVDSAHTYKTLAGASKKAKGLCACPLFDQVHVLEVVSAHSGYGLGFSRELAPTVAKVAL